jgi:hypothetical protein
MSAVWPDRPHFSGFGNKLFAKPDVEYGYFLQEESPEAKGHYLRNGYIHINKEQP